MFEIGASDCEARDGELVVIGETVVLSVIRDLVSEKSTNGDTWVGLRYNDSRTSWQWIDGWFNHLPSFSRRILYKRQTYRQYSVQPSK